MSKAESKVVSLCEKKIGRKGQVRSEGGLKMECPRSLTFLCKSRVAWEMTRRWYPGSLCCQCQWILSFNQGTNHTKNAESLYLRLKTLEPIAYFGPFEQKDRNSVVDQRPLNAPPNTHTHKQIQYAFPLTAIW